MVCEPQHPPPKSPHLFSELPRPIGHTGQITVTNLRPAPVSPRVPKYSSLGNIGLLWLCHVPSCKLINVEFASARWDTLYLHSGFPRAFPRIFCQEFNTLIPLIFVLCSFLFFLFTEQRRQQSPSCRVAFLLSTSLDDNFCGQLIPLRARIFSKKMFEFACRF